MKDGNKPRFTFLEKVLVKDGFYRGQQGIVMDCYSKKIKCGLFSYAVTTTYIVAFRKGKDQIFIAEKDLQELSK